ncbi:MULTISPECIES: amidase domain-containing protein [Gardnerella]|uniref:Putative amidase domain-containing protein n=1 Tax=Gardnerella vaginalis TaxID=2702 RepID=A0A3E2CFE5_GARVA|nr:amidase domain-containing protein [Gardnerella vaginalis]EIK74058.1 hypothetical protein CGSMWGv284V_05189 [Gardnerella vaginalis 284V]EIK77999.1 hypothetical protein CGSMWGv0288E_01059 [Gardnerella vaginalis 0288E]MBE0296098.1 amidase domain-containing protein [Gardnerella vaginalis]NSX29208.1 amidase domain-containing protein [Gardnerella vaginalis]PKZ59112.1 hypothetical protein CYJ62_02035 [Gardnerella vaginalis]
MKNKVVLHYAFIAALFSIILILSFANVAQAESSDYKSETYVDFPKKQHKTKFQSMYFSLLDTYENPELVKKFYISKYFTELQRIQSEAMLPSLSEETATIYKNSLFNSSHKDNNNVTKILQFLDIYENKYENNQILSELHKLELKVLKNELTQKEAINIAKLWLPSKQEVTPRKPLLTERNSGINLEAARAYAREWAWKINPKYGEEKSKLIFPADCTNFASQILYAGGIGMDKHNDVFKGWWWKARGDRSVSWINANVFKNYMGYGFSTSYWGMLVDNVRDGDFIGVDESNDGTVDHIGFVFLKSNGRLRIAQHTENYLDWDKNWYSFNGEGAYYRVRR